MPAISLCKHPKTLVKSCPEVEDGCPKHPSSIWWMFYICINLPSIFKYPVSIIDPCFMRCYNNIVKKFSLDPSCVILFDVKWSSDHLFLICWSVNMSVFIILITNGYWHIWKTRLVSLSDLGRIALISHYVSEMLKTLVQFFFHFPKRGHNVPFTSFNICMRGDIEEDFVVANFMSVVLFCPVPVRVARGSGLRREAQTLCSIQPLLQTLLSWFLSVQSSSGSTLSLFHLCPTSSPYLWGCFVVMVLFLVFSKAKLLLI